MSAAESAGVRPWAWIIRLTWLGGGGDVLYDHGHGRLTSVKDQADRYEDRRAVRESAAHWIRNPGVTSVEIVEVGA